jgi:hypothetical protein
MLSGVQWMRDPLVWYLSSQKEVRVEVVELDGVQLAHIVY